MILGRKTLQQMLEQLRHDIRGDIAAACAETEPKHKPEQTDINRHDMAIEDMLDAWEEWREELRDTSETLQKVTEAQQRREDGNAARREEALLALAMAYHDQLYALRRAAAGTPWERQLSLASDKTAPERIACGMQVIEEAGTAFNDTLHEVVEVVPAERPEEHLRVSDVFTCGYVYRGKVVRKASVRVCQYRDGGKESEDKE